MKAASPADSGSLKIDHLDGLRGVAALAVVLAHFRDLRVPPILSSIPESLPDLFVRTPLMLALASSVAVRIFFVHSGFVLVWKYLHLGDWRILISMSVRRVFRLGIPIGASVLFAFALMRFGWMVNGAAASRSPAAPLLTLYAFQPAWETLLNDALGGWLSGNVRYNGVLWTMPIEVCCSYIVFALAPFLRRGRTAGVLLWGALAGAIFMATYHWAAYFVVGALLARLKRDAPDLGIAWTRRHRPVTVAAALVALAIAPWPYFYALAFRLRGAYVELLQLVVVAVIFWLLLTTPPVQRFFGSRPLRFLGRTSFAIYLLHLPLLCSLGSALYLFWSPRVGPVALFLLTVPPTIVVLYALGELMSRSVDRIAIDLGKDLLTRLMRDAGTGSLLRAPSARAPMPWQGRREPIQVSRALEEEPSLT